MGRTVSSYRKTGLFLSFAVVAVYGYLVCALFPPYQFHKHIIAARMFIQHQLPNGRLVEFSPSYLYLNILMQKWFSDPLPLLRVLNIALIGLSVPMLFRILSLFYRHPVALAGTIVFILDYSLIVYAQAFEPEIPSKNWKKAWIILALSPICAFSCLPTSLMREEGHLWESTRTSRQLLKSSYARRVEGNYREAGEYSYHAFAAAPWLEDSCRPAALSFGPGGFPGSALRVASPDSFSREFDRGLLSIKAGRPRKPRNVSCT